ncbi:hypothetical protein [Hyphococcus sp.]|uniref:hypothetical protein n=1 Tax=Hyphococcus sp. TaxID=2038636 RepID=UPI002085C2B2|nr:MAG: hypothetical protein DHS20C04_09480 [Marinicaulis sp.]
MRGNYRKLGFSVAVSAAAVMVFAAPTAAIAQNAQCDAEEGGASKTLDPRNGAEISKIYELMQTDQFPAALTAFNTLLANRGDSMKPYDKATLYELRANVKINLEDYRGALADLQAALNANGLPAARNNQLRYYIAQLNFQLEQYQTAINGLNQWIQLARTCGVTVDPNAYYLLAAAYTQISPPNYRAALSPAEQAVANMGAEPRKGYFDLLNLIYSELNDNAKRAPLLERMVNYWPNDKGYWTQLSGSYSVQNKDKEAFSVLEVAYRAGLIKNENEILTLVQYYSFFDNPYRGAVMLEREMNAGNVKRVQKNLILLSQLWSQAREHKKSIPILREAARGAETGELYYRLGMVLLADEQYAASQTALESALNRGGLDRKDTGDAWLLLGTARFSQAGPASTGIWASARQAFVRAQAYEASRRRASDWITYIDAVVNTYWEGLRIEWEQNKAACEDDIVRFEQQARIEDLQNRRPDPADVQRRETRIAECEALIAAGPPSRTNPNAAASTETDSAPEATEEDDTATNQ